MLKFAIICMMLLLAGCVEQKRLEDLGMVTSAAADLAQNQEKDASSMKINVAIAIPIAGQTKGTQMNIIQTTAESTKEARRKLNRKVSQQLVSGQLQNLLFGEELAKHGIMHHLDSYRRDYSVSERMRLIITEGSSVQLLMHPYRRIASISDAISALMLTEQKANVLPAGTLHDFIRDYFDDGIDPILPQIALKQDAIEVSGIALFKDERYVSNIDPDQSITFFMLLRSFKNGEVLVHIKDSSSTHPERAMLTSLISERKLSVRRADNGVTPPEVDFKIKLEGIMLEYIGELKLEKEAAKKQLIAELQETLQSEMVGIVRRLQQLGTDSLGIGIAVRNSMSYGAWKKLNWEQVYPKTKVNVRLQLQIKDFGMIES
ncbi:Ger(x)C family spore germination protein [Paenibacillus sp. OV219]|uniref:Ger(x)C family spore germination protein n=1 Tax=Paenibacillus sp. OV219 TaxID=1884377 RepID=UPI0008AC5496|nr:Ger(x)C family spore germination protein [Paenibacillus sp. OV219]SEM64045.1 spore germination protein [Paenibacillus sp. OV219]